VRAFACDFFGLSLGGRGHLMGVTLGVLENANGW
jgi:hypothetical protein